MNVKKSAISVATKLFPEATFKLKALSLLFSDQSFFYTTGWFESLKKNKPVTQDGSPIPWMNYAVISLLDKALPYECAVFEFGSGQSTVFFAQKCNSVTSLEHDVDWYDLIASSIPQNVSLLLSNSNEKADYVGAIRRENKTYDVVVVDGKYRCESFAEATQWLSERGVLILDDSHRPEYVGCFEVARRMEFASLQLWGLKPMSAWMVETTVFYRRDNCLGL
jgi:hypothetical protein